MADCQCTADCMCDQCFFDRLTTYAESRSEASRNYRRIEAIMNHLELQASRAYFEAEHPDLFTTRTS